MATNDKLIQWLNNRAVQESAQVDRHVNIALEHQGETSEYQPDLRSAFRHRARGTAFSEVIDYVKTELGGKSPSDVDPPDKAVLRPSKKYADAMVDVLDRFQYYIGSYEEQMIIDALLDHFLDENSSPSDLDNHLNFKHRRWKLDADRRRKIALEEEEMAREAEVRQEEEGAT